MSFFFFFKQKTAYEMRISDWSSDVCSSDLGDEPIRIVFVIAQGKDQTLSVPTAPRGDRRGADRVHDQPVADDPQRPLHRDGAGRFGKDAAQFAALQREAVDRVQLLAGQAIAQEIRPALIVAEPDEREDG